MPRKWLTDDAATAASVRPLAATTIASTRSPAGKRVGSSRSAVAASAREVQVTIEFGLSLHASERLLILHKVTKSILITLPAHPSGMELC